MEKIFINHLGKGLLLNLLLLFSTQVSAEKLLIGMSEYPPHVTAIEGELGGSFIEYMKSVYGQSFELEFVVMPQKRGLMEVSKGRLDLFFPYVDSNSNASDIGKPLFFATPGLCFLKKNFIAILSAPNALEEHIVGVPAGKKVIEFLLSSPASIKYIEGDDTIERGVGLLLKGRIDALYHPNPENLYHHERPLYKQLACSSFHGYSEQVQIALNGQMDATKHQLVKKLYQQHVDDISYKYFLSKE